VLVDTPGVVRSARNTLDSRLLSYIMGSMKEADAVVVIADATAPEETQDLVRPQRLLLQRC
jgi:GTPase Era involved in 16S rRNA processing